MAGLEITAGGISGCLLMTTFFEAGELHPSSLVTTKLYVPGSNPCNIVLETVPVVAAPPGYLKRIHIPFVGNPSMITSPVGEEQVGWRMADMTGVNGLLVTVTVTGVLRVDRQLLLMASA